MEYLDSCVSLCIHSVHLRQLHFQYLEYPFCIPYNSPWLVRAAGTSVTKVMRDNNHWQWIFGNRVEQQDVKAHRPSFFLSMYVKEWWQGCTLFPLALPLLFVPPRGHPMRCWSEGLHCPAAATTTGMRRRRTIMTTTVTRTCYKNLAKSRGACAWQFYSARSSIMAPTARCCY